MALSAGADQNQTTSRILNKLQYAMTDVAADITTAATSDIIPMLDASDNYEVKYADSTNVFELMGITATAAEINNSADVSSSLVAGGGTLAMVQATHQGRTIALDTAAGSVVTLPASTGGGAVYKFLVTVTATSNSHVIKVANATDEMRGFVVQDSDTATAPNIWWAADNDDTITLNRTTTGLAAQGEYFEIVDATSGHFFVRGYSQASGTEATPFSATVS
jgi:hypothetical protein